MSNDDADTVATIAQVNQLCRNSAHPFRPKRLRLVLVRNQRSAELNQNRQFAIPNLRLSTSLAWLQLQRDLALSLAPTTHPPGR